MSEIHWQGKHIQRDMTLGEYVFNKETGGHSNGEMDFKTANMPSGLNKEGSSEKWIGKEQ